MRTDPGGRRICRRRGAALFFGLAVSTLAVCVAFPLPLHAAEGGEAGSLLAGLPTVEGGSLATAETPRQVASVLQTLLVLTFLGLAPSFLILTTCFTRIVVVLGFLRRALATQTLPPDQVMIGLALFLTIFIMAPTWEASYEEGIRPFLDGELVEGEPMSFQTAFARTVAPQRAFMYRCLEANRGGPDIHFFMAVAGRPVEPGARLVLGDVPLHVLIPAFITAELKRAFWMGFLLYLPFLILDVVIASVLMSMGMMMLPPVMVSLPFKIILFVLVDGWRLLMEGIVRSFPGGI